MKTQTNMRARALGFALLVAVMSLAALTVRVASAEAATFTVNTTSDVNDGACTAGHCSLREAIVAANRSADTDTITFNLPGPSHTIGVVGVLPAVVFPVIIDGTTQPGYAGEPIVELDGTQSGARQPGLLFMGGDSTVRGLVVHSFKGAGLVLQDRGNYRIEGNYIGTDSTGTVDRGNSEGGIFVIFRAAPSPDNGRNTIARNVISGNGIHGIALANSLNIVRENRIGTDATGTVALGNADTGIWMHNSGSDNVVEDNVISSNGRWGIVNGASCNPCTTAFARNIFEGNYVGTNASGTAVLGNGLDGIRSLGNDATIARNVISGNGANGIHVGGRSTGTVVQGNLIGTGADGTTALGNGLAGLLNRDAGIETFAGATLIGGTTPGSANTIAYSTGPGVSITGGTGTFAPPFTRNGILANSIFSNGGLGIDLHLRGVQANDPGDADQGPNGLQNYPVLTSASGNAIEGTLSSAPNTSFRLEFFANQELDPSGHGEGERFLGATSVTTNGSGAASFMFNSPTAFDGSFVSATATDSANNTSEFSGALFVPEETPSPTLTLSPPTATNDLGDEHCVTATVRDGSGNPMAGVTVRFSVSGANSANGTATTDASGVAEFCFTGTNAGIDTIEAYADTNGDSVQGDGEPADEALKTWVPPVVTPPESAPYFLLIDESSIDNGNAPNFFSPADVNDELAALALRTPLPAFDGANVGRTFTLHTGQVGDEGWFAPKTIPQSWDAAGPTADGLRNFVGNPRRPYPHNVGPGSRDGRCEGRP